MSRRKHSIIDGFPADLKDAVDEMIKSDFTYREIVSYIKNKALKFHKMEEKKISKRDIQKLLDIHYNSISNKFSHRTCFTIDEAIKIQEHFFPECELGKLFK